MTELLIENSIDQPSRILELVHRRVIAARTGQSIVLYVYCKAIEELQDLKGSLTSGQLKVSVELWFNSFLVRSQKIAVASLTVSKEELQDMQTYFEGQNLLHSPTCKTHAFATFCKNNRSRMAIEWSHLFRSKVITFFVS